MCAHVRACKYMLPLDLKDYKILLSRQWAKLNVKGLKYKDFVVKGYH